MFLSKVFLTLAAFTSAEAASAQLPVRGDIIPPDTDLVVGKRYYSQDQTAFLIYRPDGNLVLYRFNAAHNAIRPIWSANTTWHGPNGTLPRARFQRDGNLVVYNIIGGVEWAANHGGFAGAPDVWLEVQNDHNVVIYAGRYPRRSPVWSTQTAGR